MTPQPSEQPRTAALDVERSAKALALIVIRDRQAHDRIERENRWTLPEPLWMSLDDDQRIGWRVLAREYARLTAAPDPVATPTYLGDFEIREGYYGPLGPDPVASPAPLDANFRNLLRLAEAAGEEYAGSRGRMQPAMELLQRAVDLLKDNDPRWLEGQPVAEEPR